MYKVSIITFLLIFAGLGTSCIKTPKPIDVDQNILISSMDLCCFTPLGKGKIFDTLHLNSNIYGFCSNFCKDRFKKKLPMECN